MRTNFRFGGILLDHRVTCCFSGYRPEKIPAWTAAGPNVPSMLQTKLEKAIVRAFQDGYRLFVTGMSRGFDLWAAQAVLQQREHLPIRLLCAIPFDGQANSWESSWKTCYQKVLLLADFVHSLAQFYTPDCFYARDHFMVNGSSRLICWFDGLPGGTAFTHRYAKKRGLEIVNLADRQLCLFSEVSSL